MPRSIARWSGSGLDGGAFRSGRSGFSSRRSRTASWSSMNGLDVVVNAIRPRSPAHNVPNVESSRPVDAAAISFDERGLVPCVVQDWRTGEVLTLAYQNAEAVEATQRTGELHLWSRSRQELWHKGATSGNTQAVRALRLDCDGDAVLALVEPAGPACHTGARTCFHRGDLEPPPPHEALPGLERTIAQRASERPDGSYVVTLLDDPPFAG